MFLFYHSYQLSSYLDMNLGDRTSYAMFLLWAPTEVGAHNQIVLTSTAEVGQLAHPSFYLAEILHKS